MIRRSIHLSNCTWSSTWRFKFSTHLAKAALKFAALLVFASSNMIQARAVDHLIASPAELKLQGRAAQHGLVITLANDQGVLRDVTASAQFISSDSNVVVVAEGAQLVTQGTGSARVTVRYQDLSVVIPIVASDSGQVAPPSFRQEVLPLLTKTGCNAGGCHGKLAGQNGFRLSLRGYAPEWDIDWLKTEVASRRLNYAAPDESLLLLKALAKVPHQGGQRFEENSRAHQLLRDWIVARAPGPNPVETDATSLEVLPGDRQLTVAAQQQLLVRAHYPNAPPRDVTWLCQFFSNDETTIKVSSTGKAEALRSGETSVRVHFQGQVATVLFTIPFQNQVDPQLFAPVNNVIDGPVFAKLQALRIPPAPPCDDATFLRRAALDTTGTLPSPDEVRAFLEDASEQKRARLVDELLERPAFIDYWTLQLADLLQNRKERDHDVRGSKGVRAFHTWLRTQVAAHRPWNELAQQVLLASGDSVSHPEIGYYITTIGEKNKAEDSEVADSVAQAFLGTRIGCARCHNHPLERYTQDDYYHFAAFFSKVSLKRESPEKAATVLSPVTRDEQQKSKEIADLESKLAQAERIAAEKSGATSSEHDKAQSRFAEQQKRLQDARRQLADLQKRQPGAFQPRTHQSLLPQPLDRSHVDFKPGADVRAQLATWITNPANHQFSGAMVNRLWKHFMGVGLVEQVDDLRASNPPSNPALWQVLDREFIDHGYDLRHVMRLILNSRTYQLSAATRPENETERRFYSHFYARRLPAEVMLDAVSAATSVPDQYLGYPVGTRAIQLPEPGISSYFLTLFGRSDRVTACACERTGEVTLPQLLHLHNGEEIGKKIGAGDGRLQALLDDKALTTAALIEELFLATVGRQPRVSEIQAVEKNLVGNASRAEVFRDLFWALLNTKEFAFNH